jgi:hypothetical protein
MDDVRDDSSGRSAGGPKLLPERPSALSRLQFSLIEKCGKDLANRGKRIKPTEGDVVFLTPSFEGTAREHHVGIRGSFKVGRAVTDVHDEIFVLRKQRDVIALAIRQLRTSTI